MCCLLCCVAPWFVTVLHLVSSSCAVITADVILMRVVNGVGEAQHYHSTGHAMPRLNTNQNVELLSASEADGVSEVTIRCVPLMLTTHFMRFPNANQTHDTNCDDWAP